VRMSSDALCAAVLSAEGQVSGADLRDLYDRCGVACGTSGFRLHRPEPAVRSGRTAAEIACATTNSGVVGFESCQPVKR
jgi:hypothetical protein